MDHNNPGMAHLLQQSATKRDGIATKCVKVKILLDGKEYYIPANGIGDIAPLPTPPFPIHVPVAYSEIMLKIGDKFEFSGVLRHKEFTIIGTGCTMEVIDHPSWWPKRDSGGI